MVWIEWQTPIVSMVLVVAAWLRENVAVLKRASLCKPCGGLRCCIWLNTFLWKNILLPGGFPSHRYSGRQDGFLMIADQSHKSQMVGILTLQSGEAIEVSSTSLHLVLCTFGWKSVCLEICGAKVLRSVASFFDLLHGSANGQQTRGGVVVASLPPFKRSLKLP